MMAEHAWTDTAPVEVGWYWCWDRGNHQPISVFYFDGERWEVADQSLDTDEFEMIYDISHYMQIDEPDTEPKISG